MSPELEAIIAADKVRVTAVTLDPATNAIVEKHRMGQGTALHLLEQNGNLFIVPDDLAFTFGDTLDVVTMTVTPAAPPLEPTE